MSKADVVNVNILNSGNLSRPTVQGSINHI